VIRAAAQRVCASARGIRTPAPKARAPKRVFSG
jgi:hypothetical protein